MGSRFGLHAPPSRDKYFLRGPEFPSNRVYTESINDHQGMINIRALMGVCPQFDMLWDKLTADEHMEARYALYSVAAVAQLEHF
jgi:hypothetical protein